MTPIVSIIVPVYNSETTLACCVESILCQTFADFELILVDDGSQDKSLNICKEYAEADSRVRVIHQDNRGVSAARNTGIDVSDGCYIMFCDSDDTVLAQWCEKLYYAILEHPDSWVLCDVNEEIAPGMWKRRSARYSKIETIDSGKSKLTYFEIYRMGLSGYVYNKIFETIKLKRENIKFDEQSELGEDVEFNVQYFKTCDNIQFLNEALYEYHYSPQGLVKKKRDQRALLHLKPFYVRIPLIEEEKIGEYCDIWMYQLIHWLEEDLALKKRGRYRYGKNLFSSPELRFCIDHAEGRNDSDLYMKIMRTHSFFVYLLFKKLVQLKKQRSRA